VVLEVAGQAPARMSIANVSFGDSISDSVPLLEWAPDARQAGGAFLPGINVLAVSGGGYEPASQNVGEAAPWFPSKVLYPVGVAPNDVVDHELGLASSFVPVLVGG
jgi:hypothetical protein